MNKIKLITDDAANIPKEFLDKIDFHSMRIPFSVDEVEYKVSDLKPLEFYQKISESTKTGTSQVNIQEMQDTFEKYLKEGFDILYVSISSGLSGTYDNAISVSNKLKEKYKDNKIVIIDSKGGEGGGGVLVVKAAKLISEQKNLLEIEKELNYLAEHLVYNFIVSDFKLLVKNGRMSALKAFTGTVLKIKPILEMSEEGKIISKVKKIGMTKAASFMVERMKETIDLEKNDFIYLTESLYGNNNSDVSQAFNKMTNEVKEIIGDKKVYIGPENYIVGSHTGPNTIALFYFKK